LENDLRKFHLQYIEFTAMARAKHYWLLKSEPYVYSIENLAADTDQTTFWDGVRNYQARNMLRDDIKKGDMVLFYHSNAKPPGIAGTATVVRGGYPDDTAFDPNHKYYDEKSSPENPRWYRVDIKLKKIFPELLSLEFLKEQPELEGMELLRKGSRLSVQPVTKQQFDFVLKLAKK